MGVDSMGDRGILTYIDGSTHPPTHHPPTLPKLRPIQRNTTQLKVTGDVKNERRYLLPQLFTVQSQRFCTRSQHRYLLPELFTVQSQRCCIVHSQCLLCSMVNQRKAKCKTVQFVVSFRVLVARTAHTNLQNQTQRLRLIRPTHPTPGKLPTHPPTTRPIQLNSTRN